MSKPIIIIIFVFTSILWSQTEGKLGSIQLNEKTLFLEGESRKGPYFLPDSLIIINTVDVYIDGHIQHPGSYVLDAVKGEIRFNRIIENTSLIRVEYKIYPFDIKREYYHHKMHKRLFAIESKNRTSQETSLDDTLNYASQLSKSGSITRGISVGNTQGLKVNSALNINVSGKVGENIKVLAALTDQSTPIQPEGTTQNLQEIDKVFIEIESPHWAATMGDFNLRYSGTQFAQYQRKLQGVMGETSYKNTSAKLSGAVSRGKYRSLKFQGQEGNQGPYQLKGDRGQVNIIVLAGTERVYINGERMTRGESNDYIIDYSSAQITFTRRRLITSESRIVVDYQYSDEQYRRNLYSASVKTGIFKDRLFLKTTFLHEADDKDNPLDFTLDDENRNILSEAGDNPLNARVSGAKYMKDSNGRYELTKDSIYVYKGEGKGSYNVVFSDIGDNSGGYTYKGSGIFKYLGKGQGRYAPVIILPTPSSHSLLDFDIQFNPLKSVSIQSEYALSSFDRNTFSGLDDENNEGLAQNHRLSIKQDSLTALGLKFGSVEFSGMYKNINNRFNSIDRSTKVEYDRIWDLPDTIENSREMLFNLMHRIFRYLF
ncbi:MAG: hypothetical protein U5R06_22495 [candidate division KSB1 bacterium]|nr:hypothetical protein [candidate division KSB1 bacterium]